LGVSERGATYVERDGDAGELSEGGLAVGDGVIPGEQGEVTERIAGCGEGTCAIQLERTRYTARHTGTLMTTGLYSMTLAAPTLILLSTWKER